MLFKFDLSVLASERSYRIVLIGKLFLPDGFTSSGAIRIYFCDPKSPWQRATSENTNTLLRQYLPRTKHFAGRLSTATR
jgi:hypothetical protein